MKKRGLLLALAALAGSALVGGTFAAWAVTDNANPFGVAISPSTLDVGDTKTVTLDWGEAAEGDTALQGSTIDNLSMGQEKGPYSVVLKATTTNNTAFTGSLTVGLTTTATGANKLIDYLTVTAYDKKKTEQGYQLVLTVPDAQSNYEVSINLQVTGSKTLYFYFSLDAAITPVIYNAIKNDIVTLTLDWNKAPSGTDNQTYVESVTYYFNKPSDWGAPKAYAWKASTGKANGDYPGAAMTLFDGTIYSVALDNEYDHVIFTDGTDAHKTADLTLTPATPYWNGSAWAAAPTTETEYNLVGDFNNWTAAAANKMTKLAEPHNGYTYVIQNVVVGAGDGLKVLSSTNVWYGHEGTGSGNLVIETAGTYNFYFNPNGVEANNHTYYILCEQAA